MAKYCMDTSAILDAWIRYYPKDLFPSFWGHFQKLASNKEAVATELIRHELSKKDDGCISWFDSQDLTDFFVPIDESIQLAVTSILLNPIHQRLVEDRTGTFGADPFVIGLAQVNNLVVVTGETKSQSKTKAKIPNVCEDLGIPCINILELMRREKWNF